MSKYIVAFPSKIIEIKSINTMPEVVIDNSIYTIDENVEIEIIENCLSIKILKTNLGNKAGIYIIGEDFVQYTLIRLKENSFGRPGIIKVKKNTYS